MLPGGPSHSQAPNVTILQLPRIKTPEVRRNLESGSSTSENYPSTHLGEYGSPEKVQKPHVVGTGLRFIFLALFTTALSAGAALLISHPCTEIT
jgi:hypothetical protein